MAFSWTSIKEFILDTYGNKLKVAGSNTGTGVILKVYIEKTQTVGGKTTTSEAGSAMTFVPEETVSSLGSMTFTDLLTTTTDPIVSVKASQVTKGSIVVTFYTSELRSQGKPEGKVTDTIIYNLLVDWLPEATVVSGDVSGGKYFTNTALPVREDYFHPNTTGLWTGTLSGTPSVNTDMRSGRNILGVYVQKASGDTARGFYKTPPTSWGEYDLPASNQVRTYITSAFDVVEILYIA